jgi:hypothetical protein
MFFLKTDVHFQALQLGGGAHEGPAPTGKENAPSYRKEWNWRQPPNIFIPLFVYRPAGIIFPDFYSVATKTADSGCLGHSQLLGVEMTLTRLLSKPHGVFKPGLKISGRVRRTDDRFQTLPSVQV